MNNGQNRKHIVDDEVLRNVSGGGLADFVVLEAVCPHCCRTFYKADGHEISSKLYCPECWESKEKLDIPGMYDVENGVAGGW